MNNQTTRTEIEAGIKNLSKNKSLGLDGFTGGFYQTLREELMLILLKLFAKTYTKINSKWIKDHNVSPETTNSQRKTQPEHSMT